jgi:hypothetical protein
MDLKIKTHSIDEYNSRLEEFVQILDIWRDEEIGRNYEIEEDLESLNFKIKVHD